MAPPVEKFVSRMRAMGIGDGHRVIVYDSAGIFSAARVWWLFRLFGKEDVAVLDGGLPKWRAEGRPVEDTAAAPARPPLHRPPQRRPGARRHPGRRDRRSSATPRSSTPARPSASAARRPSRARACAPATSRARRTCPTRRVLNPDGTMKDPAALRAAFEAAGVDVTEAGHHHLRLRRLRRGPQPRARAARQPQPRALRRLLGRVGRLSRPEGRAGMKHRAGERVEFVVTYLAMEARPGYPRPHLPTGPASALIGAERPPVWYFLDLYDAVGARLRVDRPARACRRRELAAFLHDPAVTLYTLRARRLAARLLRARRPRAGALRPRLFRPGARGDRPRPRHLPAADRGAHGLGPAGHGAGDGQHQLARPSARAAALPEGRLRAGAARDPDRGC